jgi:hypothetical protein
MASSSYPGTYATTAGVPWNSWGHPDGVASDYYQDHSKSGQPPQISGQSQSASQLQVQQPDQDQSQGLGYVQNQVYGQNFSLYGGQNPENLSGRPWAPSEGVPPAQQSFDQQVHGQVTQGHSLYQTQQGPPPGQHDQYSQAPPPPAQNCQHGWGHGGNGFYSPDVYSSFRHSIELID